eukprot:scaffold24742_cov123-Isochrysis_galbana.AAC.1
MVSGTRKRRSCVDIGEVIIDVVGAYKRVPNTVYRHIDTYRHHRYEISEPPPEVPPFSRPAYAIATSVRTGPAWLAPHHGCPRDAGEDERAVDHAICYGGAC